MDYLLSLGLTLVVEVPIYAVFLVGLVGVRARSAVLAGVGVNLVSHPFGFLVLDPIVRSVAGPEPALILVEVWAWAVEALILRSYLRRNMPTLAAISLVANCASFATGITLIVRMR